MRGSSGVGKETRGSNAVKKREEGGWGAHVNERQALYHAETHIHSSTGQCEAKENTDH